MKALTWQGKRDVRVEEVPDPQLQEPTDAIIKVTSSAICGSDLHLYEVLGAYLTPGDILGHEPMGIVEEVGPEVTHIKPGDRVVIPFNISCGHCWMCERGLYAQCETTQMREQGKGARLFGYTSLYGAVPGGQAEYLRVPQAQFGPVPVPAEYDDQRFLYLSDILPTAWQGVKFADVPQGGTLAVLGLGPVGQFAGPDRHATSAPSGSSGSTSCPSGWPWPQSHGIEALDLSEVDDVAEALIEMTDGRGPDGVLEAVGMEAHGSPVAKAAQTAATLLPDALAKPLIDRMAVDRMDALHTAFKAVRRGGTVSISGVYGGEMDPMPMMEMFDRGITVRMGQCHVKRWVDDILPLVMDSSDPLGTEDLATHFLPLDEAPHGLLDVPGQGGRLHQGRPQAVSGHATRRRSSSRAPPAASAARPRCSWRTAGRDLVLRVQVRRGARGGAARVRTARRPRRRGRRRRVGPGLGRARPSSSPSSTSARLDGVVHSAATLSYGRFEDVPAEVFDQALATTLGGTANVARCTLAAFEDGGGGRLVVVGSLLGKIARPS